MKPLYNIRDKVMIKSHYDEGYDMYDYRASFTSLMLKKYGGTVDTITHIMPANNVNKYKIPDDGYIYRLESNTWLWTSGMFEPEF